MQEECVWAAVRALAPDLIFYESCTVKPNIRKEFYSMYKAHVILIGAGLKKQKKNHTIAKAGMEKGTSLVS